MSATTLLLEPSHQVSLLQGVASLSIATNSVFEILPESENEVKVTWAEDTYQIGHSVPATTFELFPKFPTELRLKIWEFAESVARVVGIKCSYFHTREFRRRAFTDEERRQANELKFTPTTPLPALFRASSEAREIGFKMYELAFGSKSMVYVDFAKDTIHFGHSKDMRYNAFDLETLIRDFPTDVDQIRHLAVECRLFGLNGFTNIEKLANLPAVEDFTISTERESGGTRNFCLEEPNSEEELKLRNSVAYATLYRRVDKVSHL